MEEVLKPDEAEAAIEALLFTMGEAISAEAIGAVIGHDKATVIRLVHHLMDRYQNEKRGIRIIELDGSFQMCTSPEMYDYVIKLTHQPKKQVLTDVMLETLAIVAYKQPVTKAEIELMDAFFSTPSTGGRGQPIATAPMCAHWLPMVTLSCAPHHTAIAHSS